MGRLQSWADAEKWAGADGPEWPYAKIFHGLHSVLNKILVGQNAI
jgi:hypothetical protein